jgi:hypothetical protein
MHQPGDAADIFRVLCVVGRPDHVSLPRSLSLPPSPPRPPCNMDTVTVTVSCSMFMFMLLVAVSQCWPMSCHIISYADDKGDAYRIINGVDSFGNVCGRSNSYTDGVNVNNTNLNMEDRSYLYYADPTNATAPRVCVPECPYHESTVFSSTINACTGCEWPRLNPPLTSASAINSLSLVLHACSLLTANPSWLLKTQAPMRLSAPNQTPVVRVRSSRPACLQQGQDRMICSQASRGDRRTMGARHTRTGQSQWLVGVGPHRTLTPTAA